MSLQGGKLVTVSNDGKMIVWDVETTEKAHCIPLRSSWIMACAMSDSMLATGGLDNIVSVFSTDSDRLLREFVQHDGYVSCIKFSPSGRFLLSASGDSRCFLWCVPTSLRV